MNAKSAEQSAPLFTLTTEQLANLIASTVRHEIQLAAKGGPKEVLMLDDVTELLGRCRSVVMRFVEEEGLPAHYISEREPRFRRSEVLAWLSSRPSTPPKRLGA